jgi:hypothetical protein
LCKHGASLCAIVRQWYSQTWALPVGSDRYHPGSLATVASKRPLAILVVRWGLLSMVVRSLSLSVRQCQLRWAGPVPCCEPEIQRGSVWFEFHNITIFAYEYCTRWLAGSPRTVGLCLTTASRQQAEPLRVVHALGVWQCHWHWQRGRAHAIGMGVRPLGATFPAGRFGIVTCRTPSLTVADTSLASTLGGRRTERERCSQERSFLRWNVQPSRSPDELKGRAVLFDVICEAGGRRAMWPGRTRGRAPTQRTARARYCTRRSRRTDCNQFLLLAHMERQ